MTSIKTSAAAFESWQRGLLGRLFVEDDLLAKHKKMRASPGEFLRGSYWRWCETVFTVLPHLATWQTVLAIGDTHVENFGTWRDGEGRLVWGANDFDDAARMPWPLDLVRLTASAVVMADKDANSATLSGAVLDGYLAGLAAPAPIILERDHGWLRSELMLSEAERKDYWAKFDRPSLPLPSGYHAALLAALPAPVSDARFFPRSAGMGSLGRPRFVALMPDWQGGPVLREAKAVLPSAWGLFHDGPPHPNRIADIAGGRFRAPDPHFQVMDDILLRRLSPSSRKIDAKGARGLLCEPKLLTLMGREIANCHAGGCDDLSGLEAEARRKTRENPEWLRKAATEMARKVVEDQHDFA